jgi:hypothetical protein
LSYKPLFVLGGVGYADAAEDYPEKESRRAKY